MAGKPTYEELEQKVRDLEEEALERVRAEEALHESEERYRSFIDSAHDMIQSVKPDGSFDFVNRAWLETLGYAEAELPSLNLFDIIHPDSLQHCQEVFSKIMAGQRVIDIEATFVDKDGKAISVEGSINPRFIGEKLVATHAILRDISERKLAQEALRKAHDELEMRVNERTAELVKTNEQLVETKTLLDNVLLYSGGDAVMATDMDMRILIYNQWAKETFGYGQEEVLGKSVWEMHLKEKVAPERLERAIQTAREKGIYEYDVHGEDADGNERWLHSVVTPLRNEKGEQLGYVLNFQDVTQHKKVEQALLESQLEISAILDNAPLKMMLVDQDRRVKKVNRALVEFVGREEEELLGLRGGEVLRCIHHLDDPKGCGFGPACETCTVRRVVLDTFETGENHHHVEAKLSFENDKIEQRTLLVSTALIDIPEMKVLVCVEDITDRRRADEALKEYSERLEEMVEQRTKELRDAQEELIKREKLSVLGRLTAIVSHELRNPLGVIRSSAYYLETKLGNADGKITKHLKRIEEKVVHCDSIVNELLEYNVGRPPETTMMELNPWIETVLDEVEIPAQVTMARELSPDISKVPFDKEKLRRVVVNLVENAIQAVDSRQENWNETKGPYQPQVTLSTSLVDNGVCIDVKDNGIGMDEETANRAFEPLFTTRSRGTGLGLAIVKKIVEEHGGRVEFSSEQDRGTKATVVIPLQAQRREPYGDE